MLKHVSRSLRDKQNGKTWNRPFSPSLHLCHKTCCASDRFKCILLHLLCKGHLLYISKFSWLHCILPLWGSNTGGFVVDGRWIFLQSIPQPAWGGDAWRLILRRNMVMVKLMVDRCWWRSESFYNPFILLSTPHLSAAVKRSQSWGIVNCADLRKCNEPLFRKNSQAFFLDMSYVYSYLFLFPLLAPSGALVFIMV